MPVAGKGLAMSERASAGKVATIGVDVGGTSISGGLVREDGEVITTVETPSSRSKREPLSLRNSSARKRSPR